MSRPSSEGNSRLVAMDSLTFTRGGRRAHRFTAAMGVGITVARYDQFKRLYNESLESLLRANGIGRAKKVYSSTQLLTKLIDRLDIDAAYRSLDGLFVSLRGMIERMDIFYTWYPPTMQGPIRIYGSQGSAVIDLPPIRFLESKVIPPYPYFCAWKYHVDIAQDVPFYLDNFQEAEVTNAWKSLANTASLFVLPHGDESHAGISTADIAAKVVNRRLYNRARGGSRAGLYPEDLAQVLPEFEESNRGFHFLGERYLSFMYPLNPQAKIPIEERLKHPVIFLVREQSGLGREAYENSPAWNSISDMAHDLDGTMKFFTAESDHRRMEPGDYLVYAGERGKQIGQELRSLGYDISLLSAGEITRQRALHGG